MTKTFCNIEIDIWFFRNEDLKEVSRVCRVYFHKSTPGTTTSTTYGSYQYIPVLVARTVPVMGEREASQSKIKDEKQFSIFLEPSNHFSPR
jgi:hypothetical protein